MGAVGEGSCTVNKTYVTAGEVLAEVDAIEWTYTVGASGITGDGTFNGGGRVVFELPAGGFTNPGHTDTFGIWNATTGSVEVRDAADQLVAPSTYSVTWFGDDSCRVMPNTGYPFTAGYKVKVKYWGQVTRIASAYYTGNNELHGLGVFKIEIESRADATSNCSNMNDFEVRNCHVPKANIQGFEVRNGPLAKLLVVCPLVIGWEGSRSEEFEVAVVALDAFANPCANPAATATVTLTGTETWLCPDIDADDKAQRQFTFQAGDGGIKVLRRCRFTSRSAHQFAWIDAASGAVTSISNPADLADSPTYHVMVVDTHVHSLIDHMFNFIDMGAEARFARDAMRLDGIILVDHGWSWHTDSRWSASAAYAIQKATALAYTSDRFFCGQGFEWTRGQASSGCATPTGTQNHHIIFPFPIQAADYSVGYDCRVLRDEGALVAKLRSVGHDFILIPHPMHEEMEWDTELPQPVEETVGEIVSYKAGYHFDKAEFALIWPRCFEIGDTPGADDKYSFRFAWKQGLKLGVIGSSDSHIGHPGVPNWEGWGNKDGTSFGYQRPGLAMILASSPDSCGCFRALRERRCYATSGVRFYVDFQVTAKQGGSPIATAMQGQTLTLAAGTYDFEVYVRVAAPANLKLVEVYRYDPANPTGGDHADGYLSADRQVAVGARHLERTFTVSGVAVGDDPFLFYLFAQQDEGAYAGNAAWSSPVWVEKV